MQATLCPLDASQLLRDILQHKDRYQSQGSTTSSASLHDVYAPDCGADMISPLLHSKSSDMAFHDRDNDTDNENDADIDVATDNNSCINDDDQSDDLDDQSVDTSVQEDHSKIYDHDHRIGRSENKEAKRAEVENILSGMRQASILDHSQTSVHNTSGDLKRQKRKQLQPQQHEGTSLHTEQMELHKQIQYLQQQMQSAKRKREEDLSVVDNEDEEDDVDELVNGDISDGDESKPVSPGFQSKKARLECLLSPGRSPLQGEVDNSNRASPGSDGGKKQKRKQTQPQQHDRSEHTDNGDALKQDSAFRRNASKDDLNGKEDYIRNINHTSGQYSADYILRNSFYHNLGSKNFMTPLPNSFNSHFYPDNLFRHNLFTFRSDSDATAPFRPKPSHIRHDSGPAPEDKTKLPEEDVSKLANALKAELTQVMNKVIDNAVNKVLLEKQTETQNPSSSVGNEAKRSPQQIGHMSSGKVQAGSHHHQQQSHQQRLPQRLQHSPTLFNPFVISQHSHHQHPSMLQSHNTLAPPHHLQQHLSPSSQVPDREVLKETVKNSQADKKPDLISPPVDHRHFFERFENRPLQERVFEPLHKSESDLIPPFGPSLPFHHPFPIYLPPHLLPPIFTGEPEQTEALPLLVHPSNKKKRTKVTDTRLSSLKGGKPVQDNTTSSSMDQAYTQRHLGVLPPFPHFPPPVLNTSVAIHNPSLSHSDLLTLRLQEAAGYRDSRLTGSPPEQSGGSPRSMSGSPHFTVDMFERDLGMMEAGSPANGYLTSTLTPMHLRKAKLMFFYTRYPSSSILKMYFPDVMFNKNNTAQLVKWFSNFREFFYIQMEKYARQALAEGCKQADELMVTADSELFRHLNLHYNRNNQLEVPPNFVAAVQAALREFFKSIQSNKDAEPSWKKAIYKVIARMDETLPDFFKSPNWMEQLGDQ